LQKPSEHGRVAVVRWGRSMAAQECPRTSKLYDRTSDG
jgi:hypothetical protein